MTWRPEADVGWDEEEVVGRTWRDVAAADAVGAVVGPAVVSLLVATTASVLWQRTGVGWPIVLVLALVATAVGALAVVRAWRRRVRSGRALVALLVCVPGGPTVLSWVAVGLVTGGA